MIYSYQTKFRRSKTCQTKFSDYVSYYVLPLKEKRHAKKPSFYDVILAEPLAEYLAGSKQSKRGLNDLNSTKTEVPIPKIEREVNEERGEVTPLRNIKDSDLSLETLLPKLINLLTSLNIDMAGKIDEKDYKKLMNVITYPIYATNLSKEALHMKEKEFNDFVQTLRSFLDGKERYKSWYKRAVKQRRETC